jgi:hypothetical protein
MRILLTSFLLGCSLLLSAQWTLVYENDGDGNRLAGDKIALLEAVRSGQSVRIGWIFINEKEPERTMEHFALPESVTILNREDAFAQLHLTRSSVIRNKKDEIGMSWGNKSYLFSTTDQQLSSDLEGELERGDKLRLDVRVKWFVQ